MIYGINGDDLWGTNLTHNGLLWEFKKGFAMVFKNNSEGEMSCKVVFQEFWGGNVLQIDSPTSRIQLLQKQNHVTMLQPISARFHNSISPKLSQKNWGKMSRHPVKDAHIPVSIQPGRR